MLYSYGPVPCECLVAVESLQNSGLVLKGVACLLKLPRIVLTRNLLLMYASLINRVKKVACILTCTFLVHVTSNGGLYL